MPTHDESARFMREYFRLSGDQRLVFEQVVAMFVADLRTGTFRRSLRVKRFRRIPGAFELTWARDGRALWQYGVGPNSDDVHIEWLRIGTHEIFNDD